MQKRRVYGVLDEWAGMYHLMVLFLQFFSASYSLCLQEPGGSRRVIGVMINSVYLTWLAAKLYKPVLASLWFSFTIQLPCITENLDLEQPIILHCFGVGRFCTKTFLFLNYNSCAVSPFMSFLELGCDNQPGQIRVLLNRKHMEGKQLVSNHILHSTAVSHPHQLPWWLIYTTQLPVFKTTPPRVIPACWCLEISVLEYKQ